MDKRKRVVDQRKERPANTINGTMIRDLMAEHGVTGHYKDHVIIVGARLIDWQATWDIKVTDDKGIAGEDCVMTSGAMAIVHKRKLINIIGPEVSKNFWRQKLGMRVTQETPKREAARAVTQVAIGQELIAKNAGFGFRNGGASGKAD